MKNRLIKNAVTLLQRPEMILHFGSYWGHRILGIRGPIVKTRSGGVVSIWEDFTDYWWGRKLSILDEGDFALMRRLVKEGHGKALIGIDVGSHVGEFSIDMALAGFTSVHGFEANPRTFLRALDNIRINKLHNVELICAAVGQDFGTASFVIEGGTGVNHVDVAGNESSLRRIRVPTISLDAYCKTNQIESLQLVKIDVEGYEPWVLKGMHDLLSGQRVEALIIEICPNTLERAGCTVRDIANPLNAAGYELRSLENDGLPGVLLSIEDLESVRNLQLGYINVLCVKMVK